LETGRARLLRKKFIALGAGMGDSTLSFAAGKNDCPEIRILFYRFLLGRNIGGLEHSGPLSILVRRGKTFPVLRG